MFLWKYSNIKSVNKEQLKNDLKQRKLALYAYKNDYYN